MKIKFSMSEYLKYKLLSSTNSDRTIRTPNLEIIRYKNGIILSSNPEQES